MNLDVQRKKIWDNFWKRQIASKDFVPNLIHFGRNYFTRTYIKYINNYEIGSCILENGCGSAESTLLFASRNSDLKTINLLDFSHESIKVTKINAQKYGVKTNLIIGDVNLMPIRKDSIDFVWNLGLLEHFENPLPIVYEMDRVTKRGGLVASIVPYKYAPVIFISNFIKKLFKFSKNIQKFQTWEETKRLWSPEEYMHFFHQPGLEHVEVKTLPGTFYLNMAIIGMKCK